MNRLGRLPIAISLLLTILGGTRAAYALDVQGTLPDDLTTWTGSINLIGDVTVPAGKKLVLQPGAVVTASGTDGLFAGDDKNAVELIIEGTLEIKGTSGQHVTLTGASASWYGVRVTTGTATITYADVTKAKKGVRLNTSSTVTSSTFTGLTNDGSSCLSLGGSSSSTVSSSTFTKCSPAAIVVENGSPTVQTNVLYDNVNGIQIFGGSPVVDNNTIHKTASTGIYLQHSTGTPLLTDNVITNFSSYGIYNYYASSMSWDYNNVWTNGIANPTYSVTGTGTHNLSANPLYVDANSATGLRLTSNSPSRKAAQTGADQGALPYVADATPTLVGTLFTNTTLSGAQTVTGDLTVPSGVTLTLSAGATLSFAQTDLMWAGDDRSTSELIVNGTLVIAGQNGGKVTLTGSGVSWNGVRVLGSGTATITYADVSKATKGVRLNATSTVTSSTFTGLTNDGSSCLSLGGGSSSSISSSTFTKCSPAAIVVESGSPTVQANVLYDNVNGIQIFGGSPVIDNNTIHKTASTGIYLQHSTGTPQLTDNVITNFSSYGIYNYYASSMSWDYNNVWTNGIANPTYSVTGTGTHNLSANPLYVDANSATGLRLTSNSPSRKAAQTGADQGALSYVADATPTLVGTLFTNTTLTGAQTVTGDLTVPSGVTLTIAAGATLSFAQTDLMWAGDDRSTSELIVNGTLVITGQSGSKVTLTGSGVSWNGVRVLSGGTATITYADVSKATKGVRLNATSTVTSSTFTGLTNDGSSCLSLGGNSSSTISSSNFTKCSPAAVVIDSGTPVLSRNVIFDNAVGVQIFGGSPLLDNNTIHKTASTGVYLQHSTGTPQLTDNIITNFSSYGIYNYYASSMSWDYNNVWTNGIVNPTYSVTGTGTHNISANPLFVDANADLHLTSTSPCRNKDSMNGDIGAYSYAVGALDHIVVQPGSYSVAGGEMVYYSAIGYDASNNVITGLTFSWSAKAAAGTISSSGVLTASCMAGTINAAVTATSGSKSGSSNLTITAGPATQIVISPSAPSLAAGSEQQFTAVVTDACGNPLGAGSVVWSTPTSKGSIGSSGLYTAPCTTGNFDGAVQAKSGDLIATVPVTVVPGAVASLTLTPSSASIPPSGSQQFTGSAADSCGNATPATLAWSTNIPGATVTSGGLLTVGSTAGDYPAGVTITSSGKTKSADISVPSGSVATVELTPTSVTLEIGASQKYTAVAKDSGGNVVTTPITWSVVAGGGTIDADGNFTAGTVAGTFANTIRASAAGTVGFASVTVSPSALDHLVVTPSTVTIAPSGMTSFVAAGFDVHDNPVTTTVAWSVSDANAGSITSGGAFTAGTAIGAYPTAVVATAGGKTATAGVTISAGALSSLVITPPVAAVTAGGTIGFTVVGKDAGGNTVAVTPTWSVVAGGGTINAAGVFSAGTSTGTFANTVRVEAMGLSALATVSVTAGPVVQVDVKPTHPTLAPGDTVQFTATAKDAFGNVVDGAAIEWGTSLVAGTITDSGLFTAGNTNGDYAHAVTASVGPITGSASVKIEGGVQGPIDMAPGQAPDLAGESMNPDPKPRDGVGCGGCSAAAPAETIPSLLLPLFLYAVIARRRRSW